MYAGVDIGGTKTLLAAINDDGVIAQSIRIATPHSYDDFLAQLKESIKQLANHEFHAGCIAVPGSIDREHGIAHRLGNLGWHDRPLQADAEKLFNCPIILEHDSVLGGLSESMLLPADKRVLYVTISTGIGIGFINKRTITPELANSEGGRMLLEYHGKRVRWESFASGRAILERFGKKAADITDEITWRRIAHDLAEGFIELMAVLQPDIIVVGGSVGQYFDRFKSFLQEEIGRFHDPLVQMPVLQKAARPDEAVIYGCYDLAKARYGTGA